MNRFTMAAWAVVVLVLAALVSDQSSRRAVKQATRRVERQTAEVLEAARREKDLAQQTFKFVKEWANARQIDFTQG